MNSNLEISPTKISTAIGAAVTANRVATLFGICGIEVDDPVLDDVIAGSSVIRKGDGVRRPFRADS